MDKWRRLSSLLNNIPNLALSQLPSSQRAMATFTTERLKAVRPNEENNNYSSYQDAIAKLNTLQSNASTRAQLALDQNASSVNSLPEMAAFLEILGIKQRDLESLNIIHVTGTKGKGTTCAFTESILRRAGLRTGFYSSPHLIEVRERIRINGCPISPEQFARYFFPVYNRFMAWKEKHEDFKLPAYFRFLTCMAFYTFLHEEVDVAIFEVGIGGRYDCTNIIPKPVVTGINSLGLEHQNLLGNTLEDIAWQKAGIMKSNSPCFTISSHPASVMDVLRRSADEAKCTLTTVPVSLPGIDDIHLRLGGGKTNELNVSLAVHLAASFLQHKHPTLLPQMQLDDIPKCLTSASASLRNALEETSWPGRFQLIKDSSLLNFYLDGAHTPDSLAIALKWFEETSTSSAFHVLIFNVTGERLSKLVSPFANSNLFDMAIFCPVSRKGCTSIADNWNVLSADTDATKACKKHAEAWEGLSAVPFVILDSTDAAIELARELSNAETNLRANRTVDVLITGSLHLVGTALSILY